MAEPISRPQAAGPALLLLVAASVLLDALALLLRLVLAHGLTLALLLAGWRPQRPQGTPKNPAAFPGHGHAPVGQRRRQGALPQGRPPASKPRRRRARPSTAAI